MSVCYPASRRYLDLLEVVFRQRKPTCVQFDGINHDASSTLVAALGTIVPFAIWQSPGAVIEHSQASRVGFDKTHIS